MKIITKPAGAAPYGGYPIDRIAPADKLLFLDIETTGFSPASSSLYLIGAAYQAEGSWQITQWFADEPTEEKALLEAFFRFASAFSHLIHFNGNRFDLPFLEQKAKALGVSWPFSSWQGTDIYKRIKPLKKLLNLQDCRQKTLERFLGIGREDQYDGGKLIAVYETYVKTLKANTPSEELLTLLLLHNFEDMLGMLKLLPILSYADLFTADIRAVKVSSIMLPPGIGQVPGNMDRKKELRISLTLPSPLPVPLNCLREGCRFQGEGDKALLRIPVHTGELKHFYPDHKDYYYLPEEDNAVHKSVAAYVDKAHREKARAENCYTRKTGDFLPQWEPVFTPLFRPDHHSKSLFFEITPEVRENRTLFARYALHVLAMLAG